MHNSKRNKGQNKNLHQQIRIDPKTTSEHLSTISMVTN